MTIQRMSMRIPNSSWTMLKISLIFLGKNFLLEGSIMEGVIQMTLL